MARPYRGESAEDRRQERRERLIEASLDAFSQHGIAKTTMRDICARARLTDRYFYESFRNVEEAFDAVYAHAKQLLIDRLVQAMARAPMDIEALAEAGLTAFYSYIREDPRRAHILVDAISANEQTAEKSQAAVREYMEVVRGIARTLYPDIPPIFNLEMIVRGLVAMAIAVTVVWAREGFKQPLESVVQYNLYAWRGLKEWVGLSIAAAKATPVVQQADGADRVASATKKKAPPVPKKSPVSRAPARKRPVAAPATGTNPAPAKTTRATASKSAARRARPAAPKAR